MSVNKVQSNGSLSPIATRGQTIQFSAMPTASADYLGRIIQYVGTTTSTYTNGYFYRCVLSGSSYVWVEVNSGGSDNVIEGYFNPSDNLFYEESTYTTAITGESNVIYISLDTNLLYRYNGSIFIKTDDVIPAPSSSNTESTVVSAINGASNTTPNPPSAYAMQQWSNVLIKRFIYTGTIASGATGIGTWDDSSTPTETDWWHEDGFILPDNAKDIDVSFKFDPQAGNGDILTLGGYILDTTTGNLCIKFGRPAKVATHKVAVDVSYTRNYYPTT